MPFLWALRAVRVLGLSRERPSLLSSVDNRRVCRAHHPSGQLTSHQGSRWADSTIPCRVLQDSFSGLGRPTKDGYIRGRGARRRRQLGLLRWILGRHGNAREHAVEDEAPTAAGEPVFQCFRRIEERVSYRFLVVCGTESRLTGAG